MQKKYAVPILAVAFMAGCVLLFSPSQDQEKIKKQTDVLIAKATIMDNDPPPSLGIEKAETEWRINPIPRPIATTVPSPTPLPNSTPSPIQTPLPTETPKPVPTPKPGYDRTGNEGQTVEFEITIEPISGKIVECDYATADGTAKAGEDFVAVSGRIMIPDGETLFLIPVQIIDDNITEQTEYFYVQISNPLNATLGKTVGKCLIYDND